MSWYDGLTQAQQTAVFFACAFGCLLLGFGLVMLGLLCDLWLGTHLVMPKESDRR